MKFTITAAFTLLAVASALPHGESLVARQAPAGLTTNEANPVMKLNGGGAVNMVPYRGAAELAAEGITKRQAPSALTGNEANPVMKLSGGGAVNMVPYRGAAELAAEGITKREVVVRKTGSTSAPVMAVRGVVVPFQGAAKKH